MAPPLDVPGLQEYAQKHISYEVRLLAQQSRDLQDRRIGVTSMGMRDHLEDALLEASLVHLRLLNEFLGRKAKARDVAAKHYLPTWQPKPFLTNADRLAIDRQLVHLSKHRTVQMPHQFGRLVVDCGHVLQDFQVSLEADPVLSVRYGPSFSEVFRWAAALRQPPSGFMTVSQSGTN